MAGRGGRRWATLAVAFLLWAGLGGPPPARAESWGGLTPGESSRRDVEAQYGKPTRERMVVEDGRTVPEYTYVGDRAPRGLDRMVVSFGFILASGFSPDVVRSVTLYPKPRVFPLGALATGYGTPDAVATEEATGRPALRYDKRGLFVILDATGNWAEMLLFAPLPRAAKP